MREPQQNSFQLFQPLFHFNSKQHKTHCVAQTLTHCKQCTSQFFFFTSHSYTAIMLLELNPLNLAGKMLTAMRNWHHIVLVKKLSRKLHPASTVQSVCVCFQPCIWNAPCLHASIKKQLARQPFTFSHAPLFAARSITLPCPTIKAWSSQSLPHFER